MSLPAPSTVYTLVPKLNCMFTINRQPVWQRILLLAVLGYEAAGCLAGGAMLIAEPDGSLMQMPVNLMHGAFPDFLIPGIFLAILGSINTIAFFSVLLRRVSAWLPVNLALGGLLIWFYVEIVILRELHWLHAMWGLPVIGGTMLSTRLIPAKIAQSILLWCGMAAAIVCMVANIVAPVRWPAYDTNAQNISELFTSSAPTRILWLSFTIPYTVCMVALITGILSNNAGNRGLVATAWLLLGYTAFHLAWVLIPVQELLPGRLHWWLGACTEICFIAAVPVASLSFGKSFLAFSAMVLPALAVFAILSVIDIHGQGTWQRIMIGVWHVWITVLAGILLYRGQAANSLSPVRKPGKLPMQNIF